MRPIAILLMTVVLSHSSAALDAPDQLPRTVDETVTILRGRLSADFKDWILRNPKDVVRARLHFPFGTGVRNEFRLWGGNPELLKSCGVTHPEDCSGVIFGELWESIRKDASPELVQALDCQFDLANRLKIDYVGFYRLRLGEVLERVQQQIDKQLSDKAVVPREACSARLLFRLRGDPDLKCWVRAEFSEDGGGPISLDRFFGWFGFRNGFDVRHNPPEIELIFDEKCAWPEPPKWFQPESEK